MKNRANRHWYTLFLVLLFLGPVSLRAEASREITRAENSVTQTAKAERNLYEFSADAGAESAVPGIKQELELRFDIYNRLFRFDPSLLSAPLKVNVFSDKGAYDRYVKERLGETKPGAIYLHYSDIGKRELVIHHGSPEETSMLAHQAFLQYFRAFVANPPSWMREGFAIYFSSLHVNPQGKADYEENLLWLESVKNLGAGLPTPETLFQADIPGAAPQKPPENLSENPAGAPEKFQISSWALVSFLLNGGQDYFRDLTDSFMLLSPSAPAEENSRAVMKRFSLWNDFDVMDKDFRSYLESRKTYKELIEDGQNAYSRGDTMNAELCFMTARDERPSEYAPYYYLGLLSYEEKDYDAAEQYYKSSLERGADEALLNYALGINAAAAGRINDAKEYLGKAAGLDPARYKTRVNDLLNKIGQ
ncbi:MAG: hypothetical protein FWF22_09580 [Treponema sp.]|nr:hypothetical protein [Treponema sp.]